MTVVGLVAVVCYAMAWLLLMASLFGLGGMVIHAAFLDKWPRRPR